MKPIVVKQGGKRYECLLIVQKSGCKSLHLKASKNGLDVDITTVDGIKKSLSNTLNKNFLKLLPADGNMTAIGGNYYVSDVYTFVRLCKQKEKERIYMLEVNKNMLSDDYVSVNVDGIVSQMRPNSLEMHEEAVRDKTQHAGNGIKFKSEKRPARGKEEYMGKPVHALDAGCIMKEDNEKEKEWNCKLVEIAEIINRECPETITKIGSMNNIDLIIEALKVGVEKLLAEVNNFPKSEQQEAGNNQFETKGNAADIISKKQIDDLEQNERLRKELEQLKANSIDIKRDTIKVIEGLIGELQKGKYLIDNVTGQPVDDPFLITSVGEIKTQLEEIQAETPAELRKELKYIIRKELANSDSVLNKLGCYAAYGRLPFMIEAGKEGKNIDSSRMSNIYNKVMDLLVPLGFQQIIPLLFVETPTDREESYENVTGQPDALVSVLSILCPSLSQHKEKVDRQEQKSVITDIAKLGFIEDDVIIEKTKVLL